MLTVRHLLDPSSMPVADFFSQCRELGYTNNISRNSIKFDWVVNERRGRFWTLALADRIIAMAGCHWFPEVHERAYRIQFRGCELPGMDPKKSLSKGQFNSCTFRELIPYQIRWIQSLGDYEMFLTTNHDNKNHRTMQLMARQGYLTHFRSGPLFGVEQTIWKFNLEKYLAVRARITSYVSEEDCSNI